MSEKTMKLTADELAEIVQCLSNSAGCMESDISREHSVELAERLVGRCAENGIKLHAYDEKEYLGKTYHVKPKDEHLFGCWHEWTAGDPCYEEVPYTEYDKACMCDGKTFSEVKLELLESLRFHVFNGYAKIIVSRTLAGKKYSWKFMMGNGCKALGPFDEHGDEVETERKHDMAVDDVFKTLVNALSGVPCVEHEISYAVNLAVEPEKEFLASKIEEERHEQMMHKLAELEMLNGNKHCMK